MSSLSHFVIFNPTLRPDINHEDKDLQDDLREAAQILFYTSREAGGVSRDKMLRQVGLAKGLMGFADMVAPGSDKWYGVHSQRSRMIVYSPEQDYYIYVNITGSGVSDEMLVDGLKRGYDDFSLLHSPLSQLAPSPTLSSVLDKFWTRFAFSFESLFLQPNLSTWLGGFPPSRDDEAMESYRERFQGTAGIIDPHGPLYTAPTDPALVRYLVTVLYASLPPPPELPAVRAEPRKTSWAKSTVSWVPGISRSSTPTTAPDTPSRWPGLGLDRLGGAMGSVGTVLGLSSRSTSRAERRASATSETTIVAEPVEQTPVDIPDLQAAQAEVSLEWENKTVWIRHDGEHVKQRVFWVIRDKLLLFLLHPDEGVASMTELPDAQPTLALLAIIPRRDEQPHNGANTWIHHSGVETSIEGDMDMGIQGGLADLRELLIKDYIHEIFARTSASRYLVGKQSRDKQEELYMAVGRKDASLTDADHAVRSLSKLYPELVS